MRLAALALVAGFVAWPAGAGAQSLSARLERAVLAAPADYAAARRALLTPAARALLQEQSQRGATATHRALATAMIERLADRARAARLDVFHGETDRNRVLHNPHPAMTRALAEAYRGLPGLAFERLAKSTELGHVDVDALVAVVRVGPEPFERLRPFVGRWLPVAVALRGIDRVRAASVIHAALARMPHDDAWVELLGELGRTGTTDPAILGDLRRRFQAATDEGTRAALAGALGALRHADSEPDLVAALLAPDERPGSSSRRWAAGAALKEILGPVRWSQRLAELARSTDRRARLAAALCAEGEHANVLEALVRDPDPEVRVQAMQRLSHWFVHLSTVAVAGAPPFAISASLEDALLRALQAPEPEVRTWALDAVWRLEEVRPISRPGRERALSMAMSDPVVEVRVRALVILPSFVGWNVADTTYLMLRDLRRVPDDWAARSQVQLAESRSWNPLEPARVQAVQRTELRALTDLVRDWRRRRR